MFRDAFKEVRYHPGRVVATLVAIAISVGFMAAVSIFVSTQSSALGRQAALPTSRTDLDVTATSPKDGVTSQKVLDAVRATPGVGAAEVVRTGFLSLGTEKASIYATAYGVPGEQFRWAGITQGSWPTAKNQVAINRTTADKLGVEVGDQVEGDAGKVTVTGITDEPSSLFFQSAYVAPSSITASQGDAVEVLVKAVSGTDPSSLVKPLHDRVAPLVTNPDLKDTDGTTPLEVLSAHDAQTKAVEGMTGGFDAMKYVLWVFSGIAALVGMIIISNTFTILLAQRRRQIGLLRAVGASGSQVRRRFLAEAVLLGLIGSVLGLALGAVVAAVAAWFTKALHWGLQFPATDLVVEVGIGILLTVIAAMAPSLKATRVAPLEALQPVATSEQVKKASRVRSVVCGLLFVGGLALAFSGLSAPVGDGASIVTGPMARAVVGCLLVAAGILFGAPLFIPWVLRGLGRLFGLFGATPRLAATNAVRNPRRASATATALMLACGLIITLQVATATAEKTVLHEVGQRYPVDLTVQRYNMTGMNGGEADQTAAATELTPAILSQLDGLPNVKARANLTGGPVSFAPDSTATSDFYLDKVLTLSPQASAITDTLPSSVADGQVLTATKIKKGTRITLSGNGQKVTLTSVPAAAVDDGVGIVSDATLRKLVKNPSVQSQWIKLADPDDIAGPMGQVQKMSRTTQGLYPAGSAAFTFQIRQVLNYLLLAMTALLGAAVLIALIGVSNTLGLSVIERTRESALLRALGMQKSSLRLMLLVEALMLALAGVLVGVAMGAFFGWLGVKAVLRQAEVHAGVTLGVNLPMTLGLIAVAVLAAALASVLPGRRAARATPTQALAE